MAELCGWVGKILRVDLTDGRVSQEDTMKYAERFIGGRGINAKIAWDEIPPGVDAFDPENRLIFTTGPLTGTLAPTSGKIVVGGVAPQVYPKPWYTRSCMGGHFGSELKYAGYDGLILQGKAEKPVYLWIHNKEVEVRNADRIWGRDAFSAQEILMREHGEEVKVACIGQSGERLVRFAVILTETSNAAGQGGFGAVMGSKNLKAIAIRGTGGVKIAKPREFMNLCLAIREELHAPYYNAIDENYGVQKDHVSKYGLRLHNCAHGCTTKCFSYYYRHVPGVVNPGMHRGLYQCVAPLFPGLPPPSTIGKSTFYNWKIGFEAGFELNVISNQYGLNQWELILGMVPWLRMCREEGIMTDIDGTPINVDDPKFWVTLFHKITFREGLGDALAEGGERAADILGKGKEQIRRLYAAYGYAGHWDGHGDRVNVVSFPVWIVSALQWATDTRDPFSSGHCYAASLSLWEPLLSWDTLKRIGKKLYGSEKASDPFTPYEYKAQPTIWHQHRSVLKDSLPVCDAVFPRIYSKKTGDNFARIGDMEGPSFEYNMFAAATGVNMSEKELYEACERIFNLERAIQVRNYGRTRAKDEEIIPYFEEKEQFLGPFDKYMGLDRQKFLHLLDEYYILRGWDVKTGRPTKEKLRELGLNDVANELEKGGLIQ
ncbi:MAG: aldehyde ferredoxin oxidoreductase N-terminal domain-containing protein [Candidatus Bathyarchaeia archaeon]